MAETYETSAGGDVTAVTLCMHGAAQQIEIAAGRDGHHGGKPRLRP
jgi:hypothetical protein